MRKGLTIIVAILLTASMFLPQQASAQSPDKMSYQAVIRNSSNALVPSTQIGIEFNIRQGSVTGTVVYTETQTPSTNANGLVSTEVGGGTGFNTINWANGPYFLETKIAVVPPLTTYTITGTSQLLSVPYALNAKTAETVTGPLTETDPNSWSKTGNAGTTAGTNFIGTTDNKNLVFKVNNFISGIISTTENTSFGFASLYSNTTGTKNTAFGLEGMANNTTGSENTAIGDFSLHANVAGANNSAVGFRSLLSNTSAINNSAFGSRSLLLSSTGNDNTGTGFNSLAANTTGSMNTAIGSNADVSSGSLSNATAIGYGAVVNASNKVQIGNGAVNYVALGSGTNVTLETGSVKITGGTPGAGKVLTSDPTGLATWSNMPSTADGSETKLTAGTNVTITGSGTTASPYLVGQTAGTAPGQMLYWNGSAWVNVVPGYEGAVLTLKGGVPTWMGGTPPNVTNPTTGKIWMDRNLGASQVATSSTDASAYGDLYQWGRGSDGHQLRTSGTTTTLSNSDTPGHSDFIISPDSPYDWRSPKSDNLWQGVNGINNPCPTGYRLPTDAEWEAERLSWSSNNAAGAFASPLKLSMAGYRTYNGGIGEVGSIGWYTSSTVTGDYSRQIYFSSSNVSASNNFRAFGYSVRCIKD